MKNLLFFGVCMLLLVVVFRVVVFVFFFFFFFTFALCSATCTDARAVCSYIWRCAGGDPGAGGGVPATAGGGGAVLAAAERAAETAGGGAEAPGVSPRNCQVQEQGEREFVMFRSRVSEKLSCSGAG